MSGAGFILAINLFVAALFAVAFFLVAANNKSDRVAVWFGLAYFFGIGYYVFEFLLPLQASPKLTGFFAFASFLGAVSSITVGITRRYRMPVEWPLLGAAIAFSLAANWFAMDLPRDSMARQLMYQAPYAFMQAACVWLIVRSRQRQAMDVTLMALFALSAVQFMTKPFVAVMVGGPGASAREYVGTSYALYSQTAGAILAVATGLLMLFLLARDMLGAVTARSETDPLSGVFNRRGFEDRVEPGLIAAMRSGVPAALVACDLDYFKSINDTWGHDAGDQVIESFAKLLTSLAPPRATVARMGGEEFAVFLPGINLATARLYAESVRVAFPALPIPGVAHETRLTASFGVAESNGSESFSDLRRRADAALYDAKRGGRNNVRSARDPDLDRMPGAPFSAEPPLRRNQLS